ncbi:MAG: hypothetical protein MZU95_14570 [Desulfomicrobium escambiense]|nr:hypothetical protein [Desulfomicrobium escambiense]
MIERAPEARPGAQRLPRHAARSLQHGAADGHRRAAARESCARVCPQFREMTPHGVDNYCCGGGSGFAIMSGHNFTDWRVPGGGPQEDRRRSWARSPTASSPATPKLPVRAVQQLQGPDPRHAGVLRPLGAARASSTAGSSELDRQRDGRRETAATFSGNGIDGPSSCWASITTPRRSSCASGWRSTPPASAALLRDLRTDPAVAEAVLLATCNRTGTLRGGANRPAGRVGHAARVRRASAGDRGETLVEAHAYAHSRGTGRPAPASRGRRPRLDDPRRAPDSRPGPRGAEPRPRRRDARPAHPPALVHGPARRQAGPRRNRHRDGAPCRWRRRPSAWPNVRSGNCAAATSSLIGAGDTVPARGAPRRRPPAVPALGGQPDARAGRRRRRSLRRRRRRTRSHRRRPAVGRRRRLGHARPRGSSSTADHGAARPPRGARAGPGAGRHRRAHATSIPPAATCRRRRCSRSTLSARSSTAAWRIASARSPGVEAIHRRGVRHASRRGPARQGAAAVVRELVERFEQVREEEVRRNLKHFHPEEEAHLDRMTRSMVTGRLLRPPITQLTSGTLPPAVESVRLDLLRELFALDPAGHCRARSAVARS